MTAWSYIVVFLSLALLALLLTCEWKRVNRARLSWRLSATVMLVVALAAIALPVTYKRGFTIGGKEGVLLTEGYDQDSVRLFMQAKKTPVWMSAADVKEPGLSVLHIFGDGLTREQCATLPSVPLIFHPSVMRAGVVSIYWQQALWPGEICRIQGRFYDPGGRPVKLLLTGMHTVLDSTEIKSQGESRFELRTVPVQAGRAVYRLIALNGADTLEQEPIPVEVLQGKVLKVLILAASPDFENRFIAGWLADNGHGVEVRTTISKGKYDRADLNMAVGAVDHLSPGLLDKFDVVMADAAVLKTDDALLRGQVAEKGLGLIIRDSILRFRPGERGLIRDSLGRIQVSESMYGAGKIIFTNLQTTYTRLLAGDKKGYAALWTSVLKEAAGKDAVAERWQLAPDLPVVDQPVKVLLRYAGSGLPQGFFETEEESTSVVTYLAQRPLLSFVWEGLYWPRSAGWQSVHTTQGDRTWWYTWAANDWRTLHRMEKMRETERWIAGARNIKVEKTGAAGEASRAPVGKGWFYLLVILSCLFLWVERKI